MSSSSSPCAACKFLRRKCTQGCVFAPYFPPDQPHKFAHVHRVFGASNVAKLLNELPTSQREDAVNSLAYEAEARLRDPVYGCVRYISLLQTRLKEVQLDLYNAKKELAAYIGPSALAPFISPQLGFTVPPNSIAQFGLGPIQQQHQPQQQLLLQQPLQQQHQQLAEQQQQQQQVLLAAREQEIMMMRFNGLYDGSASSSQELVLLPAEDHQLNLHHQHHQPHQQQQQQFVEQQQQQQQGMQNEEGRSGAGQ
ncbi:Lateral organ boundaries LOB domain-containing protein [Dioscorea alata]|uniref:Lateral organ boundaries LOB domain-containing protein n=1 Tax=Dioscorea alata TaxID=55571 RepID=A0ACB7VHD0_DIOAL|nr:Lateral organ boundaries LOB domain-containing protein [Dioscorea alata]